MSSPITAPPSATPTPSTPPPGRVALSALSHAWAAAPEVAQVLAAAVERAPVVDVTVAPGARAPLAALLAAQAPSAAPLLLVTATTREAEDLEVALASFVPASAVSTFPSWETLPHERLSPRSDTVGRRLAVLRRLTHPDPADPAYGPLSVVVAPVRALLQPIVQGLGELVPVMLHAGEERPLEDVVDALAAAAYVRTDLVERRGEFAVRGGILDVFPPTEEHPVRVEFWGDTVEEIRWFKVADQRSLEIADHGLWAPPCREVLLTDAVRERARALATKLPGVADMLLKVAEGIAVEGMESLAPALVDGMESLLDVLPAASLVVLSDPERVRTRAHDLVATSAEFLEASWANAAAGNAVPIDLQGVLGTASYWPLAQVREHALTHGRPWWSLTSFASDAELVGPTRPVGPVDPTGSRPPHHLDDEDGITRIALRAHAIEPFRGDTEATVEQLRDWVREGWRVVVVTDGPGLARRVQEVLGEHEVRATLDPLGPGAADLTPGVVHVTTGSLGRGFLDDGLRIAVVTETDLTGQPGQVGSTKDMRRMPSRRRNQVDPLQLRPGDNVVHEQHGVGRFVEMVQRTVAGATREYLVIEYAPGKRGQPGDRLFVPTDQLDQVTKYVGGESPTLNKMGGSDWHKTKSRARRYVREIAADLIRLYSARMATKGHAFGPDTPWQRELEDAFPYVETPDQLGAINEVKADMEKEVPMDRLICG
ncbi:MAG: CarD family transcriptional regulator, partial [Lapillicoccus sp.]